MPLCLINKNLIEEANNVPSMLCCGTQRVIIFTYSIISIVRLSEDIYNNTNEDFYNIFKQIVTMKIHVEHFKPQSCWCF